MKYATIEFIQTIKSLFLKGEFNNTLDTLYEFLKNIDIQLSNDVLQLKAQLIGIEGANRVGVLTFQEYQIATAKLNRSILYLIDQIPTLENAKNSIDSHKHHGRFLHDIPSNMPLMMETKCIVRIAEDDEILLKGFNITEDTVRADILISEIMEVDLIPSDETKTFIIRSFISSEQFIVNGDFTEWLFFVKPLRSGIHTMFIKFSIIQYIRNKARKKYVVLERKITVVSDIENMDSSHKIKEWHDTNIIIDNPSKDNLLSAPIILKNSKGKKLRGTLSLIGILFIIGTISAAIIFYLLLIANTNKQAGNYPNVWTTQPTPLILLIDSNGLVLNHYPDVEYSDTIILSYKNTPTNTYFRDMNPLIKKDKAIKINSGTDSLVDSVKYIGEVTSSHTRRRTTTIVSDTNTKTTSNLVKSGYKIADVLVAKDTIKLGFTTVIQIVAYGFKKNSLKFYLSQKSPIKPTNQDGNIYYFDFTSSDKPFSLLVLDTDSGNSIERLFNGNTSYRWKLTRSTGSIGIGPD
ncbi:MAG TPA: hypothetical protein VFG10_07180 [Saprospiraceae bacterium]|nr:hypothetical protein [Saprospiraceae bacterium]